MEILKEPYNLQIDDNDISICGCCKNNLIKEVKKGNCLIGNECGYCRYLDRPFGGCGNTATAHYGGCSCIYGKKDYMYISCETCKSPKCSKCKNSVYCYNNNCSSVICHRCNKKTEFNNKWKVSTPQQKLELYGTTKLKKLAKNKKIKGYSKCKKRELINMLLSLVNDNDFPIK